MFRKFPAHPFAELFPMASGKTVDDMAAHMAKHGQSEDIVLFGTEIVDGRLRQEAAIQAGIKPRYRQWGSRLEDGDDLLEFVFGKNFHRRDMTATERALAAAQYANMKSGMNQHTRTATGSANERAAAGLGNAKPVSLKEAARKCNASHRQTQRAKAVLEHGCKELQQAVREDLVAVSDAAAIADEEPKVQRQAVAKVLAGEAKTLLAAVHQLQPDPATELNEIRKDLDRLVSRMEKAPMAKRVREEACAGLRRIRDLIAMA